MIKAGVNFSSFNQIAQVSAIRNEFKLAKNLSEGIYPAHAISENDQVDLICNYFSGVEVQSLFGEELNVIILESSPSLNQLTIRVQLSKLNELYPKAELSVAVVFAPKDNAPYAELRDAVLFILKEL